MSYLHLLKTRLRQFREDTSGTITVEAVLSIPLLFLMIAVTFEFYEIHRYTSARQKATYTVADMISRENNGAITDIYMDNTLTLFDEMTRDGSDSQIRVSIVSFDDDANQYAISWSETRGNGPMSALSDQDVANAHSTLPILGDGEEVIVVESVSTYRPIFNVGFDSQIPINTRTFTSIRFAPKICYEGVFCGV